jgi:hypothetical protein
MPPFFHSANKHNVGSIVAANMENQSICNFSGLIANPFLDEF